MESLYERIGGQSNIELMVTAFYQRVLADSLLAPFFKTVDVEKLKRMQSAFFIVALGGPEPESMPSLTQAHQGLGIETRHLTRFTELLVETLGDIGIEEEESHRVYERISTYSNQVLGETSVDG